MSATGSRSILVVDDDPDMLDVMSDRLRIAGHDVWPAGSATEARALVGHRRPDLVVLDLILPDGDGLVLCQSLHEKIDVPIVVVSGTQRKHDAVLALRIGADDFIGKPFDLDEFEARVGALLRRRSAPSPGPETVAAHDAYRLDPARQAVRFGEDVLPLTRTEYGILDTLARRPGDLVWHDELARAVWGRRPEELGRAIDTQVRRLRKKLALRRGAPRIVGEHGRGYTLLPPDDGTASDERSPPGHAPPEE
jgi:DNA-binding response OmpR family regulator